MIYDEMVEVEEGMKRSVFGTPQRVRGGEGSGGVALWKGNSAKVKVWMGRAKRLDSFKENGHRCIE